MAFRNAYSTTIWYTFHLFWESNAKIARTVPNLETSANVSPKSILGCCEDNEIAKFDKIF